MCSFASRDPVNISSIIQHNSKTNDCVYVFERETEGRGEREGQREREGERERETKGGRGGRGRGRNLLYHMSAIVVAAPLLLV